MDDPHLHSLLADAFTTTWFQVTGSDMKARARKGTRPGDSLADITFNLVMRPRLQDTYDFLEGRQLVPQLPDHHHHYTFATPADYQHQHTSDVTYVDDAAFAIHFPPQRTIHKSSVMAAQGICLLAARRGMELNMQKGKRNSSTSFLAQAAGKCVSICS